METLHQFALIFNIMLGLPIVMAYGLIFLIFICHILLWTAIGIGVMVFVILPITHYLMFYERKLFNKNKGTE